MRILHLADRLSDRGGSYAWMLGVIRALSAEHEVRLAVGSIAADGLAPCDVVVRPGLEARSDAACRLDDLAVDADVVHLHNVVNPSVLEWAAARANTLLTVQDHRFFCATRGKWTSAGIVCRHPMSREACAGCVDDEAYFLEVQALTERRLAAARRMPLTVLSRYMREELVAVGVSAVQVHLVPPFVDDLDLAAEPWGPPCVLFVGRLVAAKGLCDAVAAWRRADVGLPLVVAGTGPLRDEIERLAGGRSGPGIQVVGWVGRDRLSGLYRSARALLLPSRWQEPFGIVGIEALAFGVPVVAWDSGGVGEWHPGPGLVPWGDVDALAAALRGAVGRRVLSPSSYQRDEALGRLLLLYGRVAERRRAR